MVVGGRYREALDDANVCNVLNIDRLLEEPRHQSKRRIPLKAPPDPDEGRAK